MLNDPNFIIENIPIYIGDRDRYIAEAFYLYNEILKNHKSEIDRISRSNQGYYSAQRKKAIAELLHGMQQNLISLTEITEILLPHVDLKTFAKIKPNPNDDLRAYLKDYHYLRRDWGHLDKSENQLQQVKTEITTSLKKIGHNREEALFLGAGVCRIVYDLSDCFDKIYATDKSFSMAYHYNKLLQNDVDIYEIHTKNIYGVENGTVKISASISGPNTGSTEEVLDKFRKVNYFVSDVVNLPFANNSVSNIFSVYFTDVIALKVWLPEVKRVLKKGGLFIHFGPLDYFFEDMGEMYSAQEVLEIFKLNGFAIEENKMVDTLHLPSENLWSNKLYTNWLFICSYKGEKEYTEDLDPSDILKVKNTINYEVSGTISEGKEVYYTNLTMPDGEIYEGAETVLDLLRIIGKEKSFINILKDFKEIYDVLEADQEDEVAQTLKLLIKKGLIEKVK